MSTSASSDVPTAEIAVKLERLWQKVFAKRPILCEILTKRGEKKLFDYAQDFIDVNPNPHLVNRREELFSVVHDLLETRLGSAVSYEVVDQLRRYPLVSTADHHGFLTHPFFLNSNIIDAIPLITHPELNQKYLIDFSFATVSLNNSSYPRGIVVHGHENKSESLLQIPLIPAKHKMSAVYGAEKYNMDDITRMYGYVSEKVKEGAIESARGEKIKSVITECLAFPEALNAPDLNSQITEVNFRLWPKYFHSKTPVPNLIYLEIETIVTEILKKYVLRNSEHLLHRFIFNPEWRQLIRKYFNNISGAFSIEKDWGTFLFWCLDDKKHRVRLFLDPTRNVLTSEQGMHVYNFTPETIFDALVRKEIFPSMMTCYLVVALYYGVKCLGGFSQVNDLTQTKEAWASMLNELGLTDEAKCLGPIQTKELGGDGMTLAYMNMENDTIVPATGIDLLIREGDIDINKFVDISKNFSMHEIMNPLLPEIYKVLTLDVDREPEFSSLTPEMIMTGTGLADRLKKLN